MKLLFYFTERHNILSCCTSAKRLPPYVRPSAFLMPVPVPVEVTVSGGLDMYEVREAIFWHQYKVMKVEMEPLMKLHDSRSERIIGYHRNS